MKKFLVALIVTALLPIQAFADCDFSSGITKVEGGYLYTRECHIKVGEMKYDLGAKDLQIEKLNKALTFKDLAIDNANKRADLWMNTSFKLEDRINTIDELRSRNQWLYFGLGVLTVFAAGYAAKQIYQK